VIESFRHKGLRQLYENDNRRLLAADMMDRLRVVLAALDSADTLDDLNRPSFRLHPLKGQRKGQWSITVRAN
jgi:proteic killer suppression protein